MIRTLLIAALALMVTPFSVDSVCACGSYATPYVVQCVPSSTGSFVVVWSDGSVRFNPWGCW